MLKLKGTVQDFVVVVVELFLLKCFSYINTLSPPMDMCRGRERGKKEGEGRQERGGRGKRREKGLREGDRN